MASGELSEVLNAVLSLIRAREVARAIERLQRAEQAWREQSLVAREAAVHAAAHAIASARRQRDACVAAVEQLPEPERFEARHKLMPLLDRCFNDEIAQLRARKRRLSVPE